jgi:hypothetical protein
VLLFLGRDNCEEVLRGLGLSTLFSLVAPVVEW